MRRLFIAAIVVAVVAGAWWWNQRPTGPLPGPPHRGDLIVGLDGRPIVNAGQLRARLGLTPVGQAIEVEILRDGNRIKLSAGVALTTSSNSRAGSGAQPAAATL